MRRTWTPQRGPTFGQRRPGTSSGPGRRRAQICRSGRSSSVCTHQRDEGGWPFIRTSLPAALPAPAGRASGRERSGHLQPPRVHVVLATHPKRSMGNDVQDSECAPTTGHSSRRRLVSTPYGGREGVDTRSPMSSGPAGVDATGEWDESEVPCPPRSARLPARAREAARPAQDVRKSAEAKVAASQRGERAEQGVTNRSRAFDA